MQYIANIVTNNKLTVSDFFNVTPDFSLIDKSLPTLIIGWKEVKELFPDQNILEKKINETTYWTFSKKEKRYRYEEDLKNFINEISSTIEKHANYRFFNFILSTEEKRERFIKYVQKGSCFIYHNSRFLYLYNSKDKMTFGISLNDLKYIGYNVYDFISKLKFNDDNLVTDNFKFLDNESFPLIKDNIKCVAYLFYLKNTDIYK